MDQRLVICFLLTIAFSFVASKPALQQNSDKKVVCYYGSWAVYRPGAGKFPVEEIDPFICTHLIYGFAGLSGSNQIRSLDAWNDLPTNWGKNAFGRFNGLKKINPKLKTILAIGGWNEGSVKYSQMAENKQSRQTFVESVVAFLERWDFDGLDMDWEYPGSRGGKPHDKENFILLLKELKEAFKPKGYLLTAATGAGKATMDAAYNIAEMSKYLDFINVMTYDYHGGWEKFTGHNSPLYARPDETPDQQLLNMNYSINSWISQGAPREKIILGMGLYGRAFTLQNQNVHGLGAPAPQAGQAGPYTREPGMLGYNEICEKIARGEKWTVVWDEYYLAPYAYKERQWVGYDNQESIRHKVDYANQMGLGGGMVWSIETDDFHGTCHGHRYPLLTIIHENLRGPIQRPPTSPPPSTVSRPLSITTKPTPAKPTLKPSQTSATTKGPLATGDPYQCTTAGWFRDPNDCTIYWWCYTGRGSENLVKQEFKCDEGTVFDLVTKTCNWLGSVPGC